MSAILLDAKSIRDISGDVLDTNGRLKVMPADYYKNTTIEERALFGHRQGIYSLPTTELIEWLKERIGNRSAIEIGAGHGVMAEALGIPATDSLMQKDPMITALYTIAGQPPVKYGDNVEKLNAAEAVIKYRPQVVIGAWVTHKYEESRHDAGGNMLGVREEGIVDHCEEYIFIGNTEVHRGKSIWSLPFDIIKPDWLFSRSTNGSPDFIAIWRGNIRKETNEQFKTAM